LVETSLPSVGAGVGEPVSIDSLNPRCGDIDLERRFPNLMDVLATDDVVVFWTYKVALNGGIQERHGGYVLLPQKR
jgi:hypothetical protein